MDLVEMHSWEMMSSEVAALQKQARVLLGIVRDLAQNKGWYFYGLDDPGGCALCDAQEENDGTLDENRESVIHRDECPWRRAVQFIESGKTKV